MRNFVLVAAAVVAVLMLGVAPAAAGTSPAHTAHRNCYLYDWSTGTNFPSVQRYVQADWETQCSPHLEMQLRITCSPVINPQIYHRDSGDVVALELNDKAHCGSGDNGLSAAIHFFNTATQAWSSWHNLCSPCSGWRRQADPGGGRMTG